MPSPTTSAVCLTIAVLCGRGSASPHGDEAALLQGQVRVHEHQSQYASSNGLRRMFAGILHGFNRELSQAVSNFGVPHGRSNVDPGAFFVNRSVGQTEPGSSASFFVDGAGDCTKMDKSGMGECILHWGQKVSIHSSMHIASGIQAGDKVISNIVGRFVSANHSHFLSQLIKGSAAGFGISCQVCYGSCTTTIMGMDGELLLETTTPTFLDNHSVCLGGPVEHEVELFNGNITLPPIPDPTLQLSGRVLNSITIIGKDGSVKLNEAVESQFVQGPPATGDLRQLAAPQQRTPPGTLPEALHSLFRQELPAVIKEAHKVETVVALNKLQPWRKAAGKKLEAVVLRLAVSDLERGSGRNVSLRATGCTPPTATGSTECKIPFGTAWNLSVGLDIDYVSEEGSYTDVTIAPKVGGVLGLMVTNLMPPSSATLPLCGKNATYISGTTHLKMDAGRCGFYSTKLIMPMLQLFAEDISALPLGDGSTPMMPMMPTRLGDLPPVSIEATFGLKHADKSPIANIKLEIGLGYL